MVRISAFLSFCTVIEKRSFSKAAQQLGLSQPAVSQQVRRLEDLYGTQLIHRQGGVVTPTAAGQAVYEYAAQIVALYEKSRAASAEALQQMPSQLTVAASTGLGEDFLPRVLVLFRERLPTVRVNMQVGDSAEILARLQRERLDLAFVGSRQQDRHVQFEHFLDDRLVLVVSPDHPLAARSAITREEFIALPLVLQQSGSGATSALLRSLAAHGIQLQDLAVIGEAGLQESTKALVRAGAAATIISRLGVLRDLSEGRLVEVTIDGLDLRHEFHIAYSRDWPLSQAAQAFIRTAREALATLLRSAL